MGEKNADKNAGMRFVGTVNDTSKGKNSNKSALDAFNKMTKEMSKKK